MRLLGRVAEVTNFAAIGMNCPTKNAEERDGGVYRLDYEEVAEHFWVDEHDRHLDL